MLKKIGPVYFATTNDLDEPLSHSGESVLDWRDCNLAPGLKFSSRVTFAFFLFCVSFLVWSMYFFGLSKIKYFEIRQAGNLLTPTRAILMSNLHLDVTMELAPMEITMATLWVLITPCV